MYYEINVAKQTQQRPGESPYTHFFATAPRSITDKYHLKQVLDSFKGKFPKPFYKISVTYHPDIAYGVDLETLEH